MSATHGELQYFSVRHRVRKDVALAEAGVVFGAGPALVQPRYDAGVAEPESRVNLEYSPYLSQ